MQSLHISAPSTHLPPQATPIATTPSQRLPQSFFCRPAEQVAPELIGYRRRTPSNETLFGEPGRFYVYVSYGIHHCVKRALTSRSSGWA